jgi:hypothetical protein
MTKKTVRRWLSPAEKAEIVLSRDARQLTGKTNKDIAKDMGISEYTVQHTTKDNISTEAREIYLEKKSKLAELALDVTTDALMKSRDLISTADSAKALSGIAAVGKFADSVHRLETNQPTSIQGQTAETHALEFIKLLMDRTGSRESALEAFGRASLEPLVSDGKRDIILRRIASGELKLPDGFS